MIKVPRSHTAHKLEAVTSGGMRCNAMQNRGLERNGRERARKRFMGTEAVQKYFRGFCRPWTFASGRRGILGDK